jgi:diguanylate cyclase (GGDEF)-like protein
MSGPRPSGVESAALRRARRAWRLLHVDAAASIVQADRALAQARATADREAEAWARVARGFHMLYFASPAEAMVEMACARDLFVALDDRAGQILADAGTGRALWRSGRIQEALDHLLPLRDEGVRLLKHEKRGALLNAIAGCYSALGRSEEAFSYMYEALRETGPARGHGFDTVLHCNLAHELLQLGDHDEALAQIDRGIARSQGLRNARLSAVLLINRVICLTELGRAAEAMPDVQRIFEIPADGAGRGVTEPFFESMAIAALRAGQLEFGAELVQRACDGPPLLLPDERVELAVAKALLALQRGQFAQALAALDAEAALVDSEEGSLRARCLHAQVRSEVHEARGDSAAALGAVRRWQQINAQRALLASRARYQAATLQTELLKLRHRLEENDAKRRITERARAELAQANEQLSRKIAEVQALQAALRMQATQDVLTGLSNRRHLEETLPAMQALALRDGQPLAVVIIDLDHFKAVNDVHGHPAGDSLLAAFGRLLREKLRRSDVAFRYGGEEFCILMPHTDAEAARGKIVALLAGWQRQTFRFDTGMVSHQSFSAGVADTSGAGLICGPLLRAADEQLLAAKRAGRCRVFRVGATPGEAAPVTVG